MPRPPRPPRTPRAAPTLRAPRHDDPCPECRKPLGSPGLTIACTHVAAGRVYAAHERCCTRCPPERREAREAGYRARFPLGIPRSAGRTGPGWA